MRGGSRVWKAPVRPGEPQGRRTSVCTEWGFTDGSQQGQQAEICHLGNGFKGRKEGTGLHGECLEVPGGVQWGT